MNYRYRVNCKLCKKQRIGTHTTYCKRCYNNYKRQWYKLHRKQEIERCSNWNKSHPWILASNMQKCRDRNPVHFRKYAILWNKNNKDKCAAWDRNKRARRITKISGNKISNSEWENIKRNQKYICHYCHKKNKKLTMDHVVALSKGGKHTIDNIVAACSHCNSSKNCKDYFDFLWDTNYGLF